MTFVQRRKRPIKILLQALGGQFSNAFDSIMDSLSEHDSTKDAADRAKIWRHEALILSLEGLLGLLEIDNHLTDLDTHYSIKLGKMITSIEEEFSTIEVEFSDINDPAGSAYASNLYDRVSQYLRDIDIETLPDFKKQIFRAFTSGMSRAYGRDPSYFRIVIDNISGPQNHAVRKQLQIDQHAEGIRHRFKNKPLWGQEESARASLGDLYVPVRSVVFEFPEGVEDPNEHGSHRIDRTDRIAHIADMDGRIREWLGADNPGDRVRIITGGPGSGKSSFARSFITNLIEQPIEGQIWQPILVEAQRLRRLEELEKEIGDLLRRDIDSGFDENPFSWSPFPFDRNRKLLLMLDGLDEIGAPGGEDADRLRKLVLGAQEIARTRGGEAGFVKVILLGRPDAAKSARKEAGLGIERVIEALPMIPIRPDDIGVQEQNFKDPQSIAPDDLRVDYWKKWLAVTGEKYDGDCPLQHEGFGELTSEPVLCYLLLLSGRTKKEEIDAAANNINLVYEDILSKILPRDWGDAAHPTTKGLNTDDFFFLQECLGLATWSQGGRVGDSKLFATLRDHAASGNKRERFRSLPNADLVSVATSFYTRDEEGYEFVHKSFADYLIARGLWRFARERLPAIVESSGLEEGLFSWLKIAGEASITKEIQSFLVGEAVKEEVTLLERNQSLMSQILETSFQFGPAAHKIQREVSFKQRERLAENAEDSLATTLFCYAIAGKKEIDFSDGSVSYISGHIARFMIRSKDKPFIPLDYRKLFLSGRHFRTIHLDLTGLDLSNLEFFGNIFHDVNFNGANLSNCKFRHCRFHDVNLHNSDLSCADLTNAQFHEVNLEGAIFSDATIDGAFLPKNWRSKVKYDKNRKPKGKPILVANKPYHIMYHE